MTLSRFFRQGFRVMDRLLTGGWLYNFYHQLCQGLQTLRMLQEHVPALSLKQQQQGNDILVLQQTLNFVARQRCQAKPGQLRVLFIIHNINVWSSVADVIRRGKDHPELDIVVASVNKRFHGQTNYDGEESVHHFLEQQNVPHIRLGMQDDFQLIDCIYALSPDVIFRQSQWDNDFPRGLRSDLLSFTRLALIPYGIANITQNNPLEGIFDTAVDSLYHRRCWRVYCAGNTVIEQARTNGVLAGQQFRDTGHPRVDWLRHLRSACQSSPHKRQKVFWSPHHTILTNWTDFGLFASVWRDMLRLFKDHTDKDFVFSPHPALLTLLASPLSPLTAEAYQEFETTLAGLSNVLRHEGPGYEMIAANCDVIITDGISMLLEAQLLNRPLIFMARAGHSPFNKTGMQLEGGYSTVTHVQEIATTLQYWSKEPPTKMLSRQQANMNNLFPHRDSVGAIIDDLKEEALLKRVTKL